MEKLEELLKHTLGILDCLEMQKREFGKKMNALKAHKEFLEKKST